MTDFVNNNCGFYFSFDGFVYCI